MDLDNRKEFLKDLTSFLNAEGGQILVGVAESEGLPVLPAEGFSFENLDKFKLQIENIIRTGITPRIHGVQIIQNSFGGKPIVEIRIPRGYDKPYQVSYSGHDKFYIRTGAGKHTMDREEIKQMFLNTSLELEKSKLFMEERFQELETDRSLLGQFDEMAVTVLHLIPQGSFYSSSNINLMQISKERNSLQLLDGFGYAHWNCNGPLEIKTELQKKFCSYGYENN